MLETEITEIRRELTRHVAEHGSGDAAKHAALQDMISNIDGQKKNLLRDMNKRIAREKSNVDRLAGLPPGTGSAGTGPAANKQRRGSIAKMMDKVKGGGPGNAAPGSAPVTKRRWSLSGGGISQSQQAEEDARLKARQSGGRRASVAATDLKSFASAAAAPTNELAAVTEDGEEEEEDETPGEEAADSGGADGLESLLDSINISEFLTDSDAEEEEEEEEEEAVRSEEEEDAYEQPPPVAAVFEPAPVSDMSAAPVADRNAWRRSLGVSNQHWRDNGWYECHLSDQIPLEMVAELVLALPPCNGVRVAVMRSGKWPLKQMFEAYPAAQVALLSLQGGHVEAAGAAHSRLHRQGLSLSVVLPPIDLDHDGTHVQLLPGADAGYGVVVAGLLAEMATEARLTLYESVFASLVDGGSLFIAGQSDGVGLYGTMRLLEEVGFDEIDCMWRESNHFVCGGRKVVLDSTANQSDF